MSSDITLTKLLKFVEKHIYNKLFLNKFYEMHDKKNKIMTIALGLNSLDFLNDTDGFNVNFTDTKKYVGENCIYNVIKEVFKNINVKELDNSTHIIIMMKIHPKTSIEAIYQYLWALDSAIPNYNVSFIIIKVNDCSELMVETLVIGVKKMNNAVFNEDKECSLLDFQKDFFERGLDKYLGIKLNKMLKEEI